MTFFFVYGLNVPLTLTEATQKEVIPEEAVYLGVENYNQDGKKNLFSIKKTKDGDIQNLLAEGYTYDLKVKGNEEKTLRI